jgi:peptide chain release factor 1
MLNLDWNKIETENNEILQKLTNPNLAQKERAEFQKKSSKLSDLLEFHKQLTTLQNNLTQAESQKTLEQNEEMKQLFNEEINVIKSEITEKEKELDDFLYPADENDTKSVFVEIRAGAGGQEAALFALDLFKTYSAYALSKGWEASIVDSSTTDLGGFKEIIMYIKGKNVYKYMKFESGVHRVQRVPATETQGRIHTSTVTVAVLPEAEEVDVSINPSDLRVDTYRAGGAGGQHVNKTDSAVRITHIPTGIVVACQDERSQIKNRAKAMKVLAARLLQAQKEKQEAEISAQRKSQMGMGQRAEKIRTYNYPQNRITDHRIELTLKKLDIIMQGNFDELFDPLIDWEKEERRKQGIAFI